MPRRAALAALALTGLGAVAACGAEPAPSGGATTPAVPASTTVASAATSTTSSPPPRCAETLLKTLTLEQKVGQLLMVGAQAGTAPTALDPVLTGQKAGGVVLLGTWSGAPTVSGAVEHWQPLGRSAGGVGLLVSADQEGGQVRHLQGTGFAATPASLRQGLAGTAGPNASTVAGNLKAAGVNINLAPVADTVAAAFAPRNGPIGVYQREYGNDPATVTRSVVAATTALQAGGVSATLKHFPGLGRVTGNTDLTADGTTDTTTTVDDAYLEPFRAGVQAGADLVMVSSATYSQIDPDNRAPFSRSLVTGLLRERLGYDRVVISDDLGGAVAVASVPPGERATRFVAAGGDIVLTGLPQTAAPMAGALRDKATAEPAFAAQVDAAATRVLELKVRRGLAGCAS